MKEILLTFDNKELKRKVELIFQYRSRSILNEYVFSYQRDGIALDVEYFKELVALSKRSTRFSLLYTEFLSHSDSIVLHNNLIKIKAQKPLYFFSVNNLIGFSKRHNIDLMQHLIFNRVSLYKPIYLHEGFFTTPDGKILNKIDNLSMDRIRDDTLNSFSMLSFYNENVLNEYKDIPINKYSYPMPTSVYDFITWNKYNYLRYYDNLFIRHDDKRLYINNMLTINPGSIKTNFIEQIWTKEKYGRRINIIENLFTNHSHGKYLSVFRNYMTETDNKRFNLYLTDNFAKTDNKHLNLHQDIFTWTDTLDLGLFKDLSLKDETKKTFLSEILFGLTDKIAVNTFENLYLSSDKIFAAYFNETLNAEPEKSKFLTKPTEFPSLWSDLEKIGIISDLFLFKDKLNVFISNKIFLNKNISNNFLFRFDSVLLEGRYKDLNLYTQVNDFGRKFFQNMSLYNSIDLGRKYSQGLYLNRSNDFAKRQDYIMSIFNFIDSAYRKDKDIARLNNPDFLENIKKTLWLSQQMIGFSKGDYLLAKLQSGDFLAKYEKHLKLLLDDLFLNKNLYNVNLYNSGLSLFKENYNLQQDSYLLYDVLKDLLPLALYTDYNHTVLSLNKVNDHIFMDNIMLFMRNNPKNTKYSYHDDITATKLVSDINLLDTNLICDKLAQNINFITFINDFIHKGQIKTWFINEDIFVDKSISKIMLLDSTLFAEKKIRSIMRQEFEGLIKTINSVFIENQILLDKNNRTINIYKQQEEFSTHTWLLNLFPKNEWFSYYKLAFVNQSMLPILRPIYDLGRNVDNITVDNVQRETDLFQINKLIRTNSFPMQVYNQNLVLTKDLLLNVLPEIDEIHKIIKEANISTDSTMDWAWTYQDDEPFDDPFKIDELLLPENDSRYEDFEDIIFNRQTGKPRAPIQIIDDNTFIAKFPNHYPIKDENGDNAYENIAIEYLDVRTSIMRKVFLGYYQVWQDNIFEFAKMTIPQSAKKMLDYLYTWILMNFAEEDIPEALRTFRLVRWYLERGIIETSEYCISYEPDDLTSGKLDNTNFPIPSDLNATYANQYDDPLNSTMYIDTNMHVIRNDSNKLRHEAHITFYVENSKDTTISFDLHTFTPVYIMINEEIIDTITLPTTGKIVYNIPYTGDVNKFKIGKLGVDNNDNFFFIGNIKIEGVGKTGELDISFNPKIQGNKVLNHVSQKVIAYMNLYEDNEELMQNLIKGNVHLSEVYERLLEYWNIHHQEKDKGKRLTIKRT